MELIMLMELLPYTSIIEYCRFNRQVNWLQFSTASIRITQSTAKK